MRCEIGIPSGVIRFITEQATRASVFCAAFGWSDFHLHRFRIHGKDFGVPRRGGLSFAASAHQVHLAEFHFRLGECFLYEYDFGDQWEHQIRRERILPLQPKQTYPVCMALR